MDPGGSQLQVVLDLPGLTTGPDSNDINSNTAYNALTSITALGYNCQEDIEDGQSESPEQQESYYYEIPHIINDEKEDN